MPAPENASNLAPVLTRTGRLLTCVFIFAVAGGHWGVMQIAAWSGMAAGSPDSSFFGALFEAPCENCLAVLNGSQEERDDPQSAAGAKGTLIAGDAPRPLEIFPPGVSFELDDHPPALSGIRLAPSHGPPRGC